MDKITDTLLCNGCHTCYSICPQKCIDMVENNEGFLEPIINKEKCINCKFCINRCPVNNNHIQKEMKNDIVSMVAINKDDTIRKNSSSGGVFSELANYVIEQDGIVYGAGFNDIFEVEHMRITNKDDICKLQGSKYVQSKIGNIFLDIKKELKLGRRVLFTGTPCQVEGLLSFLGKEYDNLFTQDIICHGVPSPKAWRKYIKEFKEDIKNISFRDKTMGWKDFSVRIETEKNKYINTKDIFLQSFLKNINLRQSCYNCSFKKINRNSDITLADFWGIEDIDKKYFDNKGTSLVILQSDKGKFLYSQVEAKFLSSETQLKEAVKYNSAINKSVEMTEARAKFFKYIDRYNYNKLVEKSMKVTILERTKNIIVRIKNKRKIYL